MQVLDKLSYKNLVKVYLSGQYDQVNEALESLHADNIYSYLIEVRLLINNKEFIRAQKIFKKIDLLNTNREDYFLISEINFTRGRLNYLILQNSRQDFLAAAAASLKNNDLTAFVRSRLNAMLDLMNKNNWDELDTDSFDVHAKLIELKASESEIFYSQIKYFQSRSSLAQNKNHKSFELYQKTVVTKSFENLPQSEKNNFHLYAIESLIYLNRIPEASAIMLLIKNETLSAKNSVIYFKWLIALLGSKNNEKIIFNIENLNDSLCEKALFFINLVTGQNHATLCEDNQLKLWNSGESCEFLDKLKKLFQIKFHHEYTENSLKANIINLLQTKLCTKWELINLIANDTNQAEKLYKAELKLNKIISEINYTNNFKIVNQFGHYALTDESLQSKKTNQTQIIIQRLKQGPASLNDLVNAIYFFPLNETKSDFRSTHDQIKRIIRRIKSTAQFTIANKDNLYYLK